MSKIGYLLPFSPFRGIVWFVLDKNSTSLLDVGCGKGAIAEVIKLVGNRKMFIVGVDAYLPYLKHCKGKGLYDDLVLCDARFLPFKKSSFDAVLAIEVIEHLQKRDGVSFLKQVEEVACRQVIVSTPVGFMETFHKNLERFEDELLRHKSGWSPEEFKELGYKVRGSVGPSILPRDLAYWLSFVLPFTYFTPNVAYSMICIKNKASYNET
jgi:SAM-dependent methyltransferase